MLKPVRARRATLRVRSCRRLRSAIPRKCRWRRLVRHTGVARSFCSSFLRFPFPALCLEFLIPPLLLFFVHLAATLVQPIEGANDAETEAHQEHHGVWCATQQSTSSALDAGDIEPWHLRTRAGAATPRRQKERMRGCGPQVRGVIYHAPRTVSFQQS